MGLVGRVGVGAEEDEEDEGELSKVAARTKTCTSCGRTLPRSRRFFHSKGVSPWTGRRYYASECIDCRNRRLAGKRQRTPRGTANKRQYSRVRSRALRRLAEEHPERYWELFEEELIRDARQPRRFGETETP